MGIAQEFMDKVKKRWIVRLFDMNDDGVSSTTLFMVVLTLIGCVLLIVPAISLLIEVYYNHTITTDLSGMAAYIGAVTTLFASAGITKAWSNWANYKYNSTIKKHNKQEDQKQELK